MNLTFVCKCGARVYYTYNWGRYIKELRCHKCSYYDSGYDGNYLIKRAFRKGVRVKFYEDSDEMPKMQQDSNNNQTNS